MNNVIFFKTPFSHLYNNNYYVIICNIILYDDGRGSEQIPAFEAGIYKTEQVLLASFGEMCLA